MVAVTSCTTPEGWAVLDVSEAGPCAKPPGRTAGVVIVVFGVWSVITGWPIVHGAWYMVSATPPVTLCVPPRPKPAPPGVGVRGSGMKEMQPGPPKVMHSFAIPDKPIGPPPGGPPEIPEKLPLRFCASVNRSDEMPVTAVVRT